MTQGAWFVLRKNLVGRPRCTPQRVFSFQKEDLCSLQQVTKPGEADADRRPRRPKPEPHAGSEIICLEEQHTRGGGLWTWCSREPGQDSGHVFLGTSRRQIWSPLGVMVTVPPSQPVQSSRH